MIVRGIAAAIHAPLNARAKNAGPDVPELIAGRNVQAMAARASAPALTAALAAQNLIAGRVIAVTPTT
jgi:hypothetical protein